MPESLTSDEGGVGGISSLNNLTWAESSAVKNMLSPDSENYVQEQLLGQWC